MQKYGLDFGTLNDEFRIELAMYAREDLRQQGRPLSKWEHFRKAIRMVLPDKAFAWHRWVDDFGEEWCERTQVNVWGAGGTTKSGIVGCFCYFDLLADPKNTLTVMVTNPLEKHWDRCYSKTLQWRAALPPHLRIGKSVKSPKPALLTVEGDAGSRRGILCISIDKGETSAEIGKKVGAHAPRTRLILEEGQTLPEDTLDIATNLFMGSVDKKEIDIGNPMAWTGNALGKGSLPLSGDTSEIDKKQPDRWLTKRSHADEPGITLVFDGLKCPTHDSPEEAKRLFFMIQPRDIKSAMDKPGAENTLNFWSQIRGRVPPAGQILTLFSELDWLSLMLSQTHPWKGTYDQFASADLSLGGDAIAVYRWGVGMTDLGKVAQKLERQYITVDITKPNRNHQIGSQFAKLMRQWGIRDLKFVSADCSGQQGAIADKMEEECHKLGIMGYIYRVRSEEAVTERRLSNGRVQNSTPTETIRERACDRYADRATELLMNLPELIQAGLIWGLDDEVKTQLCTRGYDDVSLEGGKTKAQKKKEWRESNQEKGADGRGKSPDELDAVCVFTAHMLEKKHLVPGVDTRPKPVDVPSIPKWMQKGQQKPSYVPRASLVARTMRGLR
jgi:hypothetical protein